MLDLKALLTKLLGCAYITGTSGVWTYKKYGDGTAECWCRYSGSMAINTAAASYGGYRSAELSILNFPFTFASVPTVIATAGSSQGFWVNNIATTTTTGGKFYLSCGSSLAAATRIVNFHVYGRWK